MKGEEGQKFDTSPGIISRRDAPPLLTERIRKAHSRGAALGAVLGRRYSIPLKYTVSFSPPSEAVFSDKVGNMKTNAFICQLPSLQNNNNRPPPPPSIISGDTDI